MMRELYQEILLDHNRAPRNFGPLLKANKSAEGYNPLCGDRVKVAVTVRDDLIEDVRFEGAGCAISTASASVMTEAVKGKTLVDAERLFHTMIALLTGHDPSAEPSATTDSGGPAAPAATPPAVANASPDSASPDDESASTDPWRLPPDTDKLLAFGGVRDYPMRVKCATLAWHTLRAALADTSTPVSTE